MKLTFSRKWVEPALLFIIAILAYGLFIPTLGLFGDDWPHLWVLHTFGISGLNELVAWDRPFSAWVYWIIAPLAGDHIWAYHIYLLLLRWICAFIFYHLIIDILPDSHPLPFWTASFFLLYPGFRQQPQPLEFILHFTALALLLISFRCMIKAFRNPKRSWVYQIAGSICALSLFSVEYFIGLELLRPVFLWIIARQESPNWKTNFKKVLGIWLPYIVILAAYGFWRVFIFKFPTYKPTFLGQVGTHPLEAIAGLGQVLVEEIRATIMGAWRQILSLPMQQRPGLVYFGLVVLVTSGIFFWLKQNKKSAETTSSLIPLLVGSISICLAGIPFWITGIPVQLEFPWDRSTLPFMVGASLLVAGSLLLFKPIFRNILASLLIALTIGMHFQNTVLYQAEWQKLNQFFWQLSWRAPSLEPGTIVISDKIPLFYYGDNNLTPVLNWTYSPDGKSRDLTYNFFDMGERLGKNLPDLKPDLPVSHGYRFVNFKSTSSALLPVFYKEGSCLRIIDERTSQISSMPKRLRAAAEFSKPQNRILTEPQSKPPEFMPEPDHTWCYYYQKAELAVQQSDWNSVGELYDQAVGKNFLPTDKTEWLPFIEAMAKTGKFDMALELTRSGLEQEGARPAVCGLWNRISMDSSLEKDVSSYLNQSGCR